MDATSLFYAAIVGATSFLLLECVARAFMRGVARIFRGKSHRTVAMLIALFVAAVILGGEKVGDRGGPGRARRNNPPAQSSVMRGSTDRILASLRQGDTDTDGDGIPDWWEIRTFGDPNTADSSLDRDGDGLTDLEEYGLRTDPRTRDTDADGMDDGCEVRIGEDPLAPADYAAVEDDSDGDGVPDALEECGHGILPDVPGVYDAAWQAASRDNFDVLARVTTSRACALTWGDARGLIVPPCTNREIRIRIEAADPGGVRLAAPPGAAGLWLARLEIWHDNSRGLATDGNRIRTASGMTVDYSANCASFIGPLPGSPPRPRSEGQWGGDLPGGGHSIGVDFMRLTLSVSQVGSFCRRHGPSPTFAASGTNLASSLEWSFFGHVFTNGVSEPFTVPFVCADLDLHDVTCRNLDGKSGLVVQSTVRPCSDTCPEGGTNIVGAAQFSTHDPDDARDHLPGYTFLIEQGLTWCPPATNHNYVAGFKHSYPICTRNLVRIVTGDPWDDETDHCMATCTEGEYTINLFDLLDQSASPIFGELEFRVNGAFVSNPQQYKIKPGNDPLDPRIVHIEVVMKSNAMTLDRMWLVACHVEMNDEFKTWYDSNSADVSWASRLPKPYPSIRLTGAGNQMNPVDPEPGAPNLWGVPTSFRSGDYLHHNASYEIRAYANSEGHGNQACYDERGNIILSTIAGGTADYYPGAAKTVLSHLDSDVFPFVKALWLDGNPGALYGVGSIMRPCLHQGKHTEKYIYCRPIISP